MAETEILGLQELGANLDLLTQKVQRQTVRNATRDGARVYRDGMKQRVAKASGELEKAIEFTTSTTRDGGYQAKIGVRYTGKVAASSRRNRALRVDEFGRTRNWINRFGVFKSDEAKPPSTEDPGIYANWLEFGRPGAHGHTHQTAQPFMRPTFDQDTPKAEQAFADRFAAEIAEGLK